jgi:hypothetical protein
MEPYRHPVHVVHRGNSNGNLIIHTKNLSSKLSFLTLHDFQHVAQSLSRIPTCYPYVMSPQSLLPSPWHCHRIEPVTLNVMNFTLYSPCIFYNWIICTNKCTKTVFSLFTLLLRCPHTHFGSYSAIIRGYFKEFLHRTILWLRHNSEWVFTTSYKIFCKLCGIVKLLKVIKLLKLIKITIK